MKILLKGFKENRQFRYLSLLVMLIILITILAPYIVPYDPLEANLKASLLAPNGQHWLGTDKLGRDLFSRIICAAQYTLTGVFALVTIVFFFGSGAGLIAGFYGGKIDTFIMRIADIMISFPGMILAIAVAGIMGGSLINAVLAVAAVTWTKYARLVRSVVLQVKHQDYIAAARINGGTSFHILWHHVLPNALPIAIVTAVTDIGSLMMELAGLSFLGFGVQAPAPEWGLMLDEGRQFIQTAPWLMIFPGFAIFITVIIFNLWGDSVRDVVDPRQN